MQKAIIVDVDGVLADCSARLVRAKKLDGKMDWPVFYNRMDEDILVPSMRALADTFRITKHDILLVTGRPQIYAQVTEEWLKKNEVVFDYIFFRQENDFRPAPIFKKSIYQNHIEGRWDVRLAVDDDERIAKMYLSDLQVPCIVPAELGHIQETFNCLDQEAVLKIADEVATNHITMAILDLNDNSVPDDTNVRWLKDYSLGLARDVARRVRG